MRVIVDTSVLIALDRIGHVDLLRRLFGSTDESASPPAIPVFLFSGCPPRATACLETESDLGKFFRDHRIAFFPRNTRESPRREP
jgi:hypothetical protein